MSPVKRRKSDAQEAPATIEQATEMVAHYHAIMLKREEIATEAATAIATIEAERDRFSAPLEERAKDLFAQLQRWWAVAGDTLTEGKRRSIDLAGCKIGIRTSTPSLKMPRGLSAAAAIVWLRSLPGKAGQRFVRTKDSLDKQAIIKLLSSNDDPHLTTFTLKGFTTSQKDEFFIDTVRKPEADPIREGGE